MTCCLLTFTFKTWLPVSRSAENNYKKQTYRAECERAQTHTHRHMRTVKLTRQLWTGWLHLLATIWTQEVRGQTFFLLDSVFTGSSLHCRCLSLLLMFCRIVLLVTVAVRDKQRYTIGCHMRPPPSLPRSANLFSLRWSIRNLLYLLPTRLPLGCICVFYSAANSTEFSAVTLNI